MMNANVDTETSEESCSGLLEHHSMSPLVPIQKLVTPPLESSLRQGPSRLALPVEVIERILKYVFLRTSKLTPTSDPYHLNRTSHVLLVSRAIHSLCLPLLYQSITISRPSHWITFFDPEDGLFSGEEGRERWSFVKELSVVLGVEPPVISEYEGREEYLSPLESPTAGRRLDVLCFLNKSDSRISTKVVEQPDVVELIKSVQEDEERRTIALQELEIFAPQVEDPDPDDEEESDDEEERINDWIEDEVLASLKGSRFWFCARSLLPNINPLEIRLSLLVGRNDLSLLESWTSSRRSPRNPITTLSIYESSSPGSACTSAASMRNHIDAVQGRFSSVSQTHLHAFAPGLMSEFAGWIETNKRIGHPPTDLWTWTLEDGTVVVIEHPH